MPSGKAIESPWLEEEANNLNQAYEIAVDSIRSTHGPQQQVRLNDLKLVIDTMMGDIRYGWNTNDMFLGENQVDQYLIECMYCALFADLGYLQSALKHSDDHDAAVSVLEKRTQLIVRAYPVSTRGTTDEKARFLMFLCRASQWLPRGNIEDLLEHNLARWESDTRIPALLFLARGENSMAKAELDNFSGHEYESLKALYDVQMRSVQQLRSQE